MAFTEVTLLPPSDSWTGAQFFKKAADEILIKIFLRAINNSDSIDEALKVYARGRLVNRRFHALFNDHSIFAALLKKSHCLPIEKIRELPTKGIYIPLLQETYERLLRDAFNKNGLASEAIIFLNTLGENERAQIGYVSLSLLKYPKPSEGEESLSTEEWERQLTTFFTLLPGLRNIRFPSKIAHAPRLLQALSSSGNGSNVTSVEIQSYGESVYLLEEKSCLTGLTSIYLNNCHKLTNTALQQILQAHPGVTTLALIDTPQINLSKLEFPKGFQLKKCVLRGTNFNSRHTFFLLNQFHGIESLGISSTQNNRKSIMHILRSPLPFRELDLSHLDVKDEHIVDISPKLRGSLRSLKLYGCKSFTNVGAKRVLDFFPNLEYLDVRYCDQVCIDPCSSYLNDREIKVLF